MRPRHSGWSKGYSLGSQLTLIVSLAAGRTGSHFSKSEFHRIDHSEMPAWTARCGFAEAHTRAAFSSRILCNAADQAFLWGQKRSAPAGCDQRRGQSRYRRGAPSTPLSSASSSQRFRSKERLGGDSVPSGQRRPFRRQQTPCSVWLATSSRFRGLQSTLIEMPEGRTGKGAACVIRSARAGGFRAALALYPGCGREALLAPKIASSRAAGGNPYQEMVAAKADAMARERIGDGRLGRKQRPPVAGGFNSGSRYRLDLNGLRKYTAVVPFPPRPASRSPLPRRPRGPAGRTWCRAGCSP